MKNIKETFPAHKDTVEFGPDVCCAFENSRLNKQNEEFLKKFSEKNIVTDSLKNKNVSLKSLLDIFKRTISLGFIPDSFEREFYVAVAEDEISFLKDIYPQNDKKFECGHSVQEHISALQKIQEKLSEKYGKN